MAGKTSQLQAHPNGKVKKTFERPGGQIAGLYTEYYDNEQVKIKCFYSYGQKHGTWKHWYPDGSRREERNYHMDHCFSSKQWGRNGKLVRRQKRWNFDNPDQEEIEEYDDDEPDRDRDYFNEQYF